MLDAPKSPSPENEAQPRPRAARTLPRVVLAIGIALYVLILARTIGPSFPPGDDDIRYLMLGLNLCSGQGYTDNYKPLPTPHLKFPPVFPVILALTHWIAPEGMIPLRIAVASFGLLALISTYLVFKHLLGELLASLLTSTVAIQLCVLRFSQRLMSEMPYLFFSMLTLLLILKRPQRKRSAPAPGSRRTWRVGDGTWYDVAIGVSIALTILTRNVGLSLFLAFLFGLLLDRARQRESPTRNSRFGALGTLTIVAITVLLLVGAWEIRNYLALGRPYSAYAAQFLSKNPQKRVETLIGPQGLLQRGVHNARFYAAHFASMTLPNLKGIPGIVTFSFWFGAIGWLVRLVRKRSVVELYVAFYGLIFLVWPWSFDRFVLPVAPFVIFYCIYGFGQTAQFISMAPRKLMKAPHPITAPSIVGQRRRNPSSIAMLSLAVIVLFLSIFVPVHILFRTNARDTLAKQAWHGPEFDAAMQWIRDNTPQDAVILTERPVSSFLISGRKSFSPGDYRAQKMFDEAVSKGNLFVIQGPIPQFKGPSGRIDSLLAQTRGRWHVVFHDRSTFVVTMNRAPGGQG